MFITGNHVFPCCKLWLKEDSKCDYPHFPSLMWQRSCFFSFFFIEMTEEGCSSKWHFQSQRLVKFDPIWRKKSLIVLKQKVIFCIECTTTHCRSNGPWPCAFTHLTTQSAIPDIQQKHQIPHLSECERTHMDREFSIILLLL